MGLSRGDELSASQCARDRTVSSLESSREQEDGQFGVEGGRGTLSLGSVVPDEALEWGEGPSTPPSTWPYFVLTRSALTRRCSNHVERYAIQRIPYISVEDR